MNKAQLQKNVGSRVRLRPQATEALGAHDDDWTVCKVSDETFAQHLQSNACPAVADEAERLRCGSRPLDDDAVASRTTGGPLSTIRSRMDRPFFRFVSLSMRQRVEEDVNTDGVPG